MERPVGGAPAAALPNRPGRRPGEQILRSSMMHTMGRSRSTARCRRRPRPLLFFPPRDHARPGRPPPGSSWCRARADSGHWQQGPTASRRSRWKHLGRRRRQTSRAQARKARRIAVPGKPPSASARIAGVLRRPARASSPPGGDAKLVKRERADGSCDVQRRTARKTATTRLCSPPWSRCCGCVVLPQQGDDGLGHVEPVGAELELGSTAGAGDFSGAECGDLAGLMAVEHDKARWQVALGSPGPVAGSQGHAALRWSRPAMHSDQAVPKRNGDDQYGGGCSA
jgi:hypothetical protein